MIRMGFPFLLATAFFIICLVCSSADGSYKPTCPAGCLCTAEEYYTTVHCASFAFIKKLTSKELLSIESLDVSNASLSSLDKHLLKKLVNLERLNLSHNRLTDIKHFPFLSKLTHLNLRSNLIKTLPSKQLASLEVLDISHNYIREIAADLPKWTKLKRIYLDGNVFICSRESLDTRDALLDKKIKLIGNPICSTPAKFHGKSWIRAVDFDEYIKLRNQDDMLADEPEGSGEIFAGSGQVAIPDENRDNGASDFDFGSGEPDFEPDHTEHAEYTTELYPEEEPVTPAEDEDEDEDEGSGDIDDEVVDEGGRDIFSTTEAVFEPIITKNKSVGVDAVQRTTTAPPPVDRLDTTTKALQPDDNINEELGNVQANKSNQGSIGTNIFLVIMLFALVALLVYLIKKRKASKRSNARKKEDDLEKSAGIELLPKSHASQVAEKQNGNTEMAPLLNGQNGEKEQHEAADEMPPADTDRKTDTNGMNVDGANSPPRSPKQDVLSVKVRASEIPDSVPTKPILVDRRKTSDGQNVIVTPNLNQRMSSGV